MPWSVDASCSESPWSEADWWPGQGTSPGKILPFIELCSTCPVRRECLTYALETRSPGIWGATAEKDRARLLTPPGNAHDLTVLPEHNTPPPDPEEVRVAAQILEEDLPRRLRELRTAARAPSLKTARTCAHCSKTFMSAVARAQYCNAHRTKRLRRPQEPPASAAAS